MACITPASDSSKNLSSYNSRVLSCSQVKQAGSSLKGAADRTAKGASKTARKTVRCVVPLSLCGCMSLVLLTVCGFMQLDTDFVAVRLMCTISCSERAGWWGPGKATDSPW